MFKTRSWVANTHKGRVNITTGVWYLRIIPKARSESRQTCGETEKNRHLRSSTYTNHAAYSYGRYTNNCDTPFLRSIHRDCVCMKAFLLNLCANWCYDRWRLLGTRANRVDNDPQNVVKYIYLYRGIFFLKSVFSHVDKRRTSRKCFHIFHFSTFDHTTILWTVILYFKRHPYLIN